MLDRQASLRLFLNTHPHEFLGGELLRSLEELQKLAGRWKLVVEIHEAAMPQWSTMVHFRKAVKQMGIELAYDDFGIGQARLRELSELPPDYIKFDRTLVHNLATADPRRVALVRSLVDLCRCNDVKTIAEGLENSLDGALCEELGFELFQGYFYGKPTSNLDIPTLA